MYLIKIIIIAQLNSYTIIFPKRLLNWSATCLERHAQDSVTYCEMFTCKNNGKEAQWNAKMCSV